MKKKTPTRKGYRGNDCGGPTPPVALPRVPAFDRIRRFCSLEPQTQNDQPNVQSGSSSTNIPHERSRLPLLGNLHKYGIDANRRERLWELEIRRLQSLNLSAEEGLKPDVEAGDTFLKAKIEGNIFDNLEALASTIRLTLFACIVDDAVEATNFSRATFPSAENYLEALRRVKEKDSEPHVPGVRRWDVRNTESRTLSGYTDVNRHTRSERSESPERPKKSMNDEFEDRYYTPESRKLPQIDTSSTPDFSSKRVVSGNFHYLVDQITATIAQVAIRVSESDYWLIIVLGCLAKLTTKMKIIHSNFFEFIDISVSGAQRYDLSTHERSMYSTIHDDSPVVERHIREHIIVSSWLAQCITTILDNLGDRRPWWKEDNYVDFCTLAFDVGLKPTQAVLCQNNHGRLAGSSDKMAVSFSSVALETVWKLSDMITSKTLNTYPEGITDQQSEQCIELHLDLEENLEGKCRRSSLSPPTRLHNIIDYITLIIPSSLTDPLVAEEYQSTLKVISSLSAFGVPNTRQIRIQGFVALRLKKDLASQVSFKSEARSAVRDSAEVMQFGHNQKDEFDTASSLLESFLLRQRRCLLDCRIDLEPESLQRGGILTRLIYKLRRTNKSREEIWRFSRNWTIQEKAVVVPCPKYVISVAFLTVALVAGGMACAFIVGERIPGVDPFNLTNFSWLVGGLSILIAKSMRVSDWTWRDFLSGQVSCRTVQELSDVTGLNTQDILFFLLSSEMDEVLLTGGPFQKAFARFPEIDGFSIDVKPNLQTLLASGIVLVNVVTLDGPALLWLHLIPGRNASRAVRPSGTGGQGPVCRDPPQAQGSGDAITTFEDSISWIKVLGLYNLKDVEFR